MRLFLREGERIQRKSLAQRGRVMRAAMWSSEDAFNGMLDDLEE
jgi:hypothetical protein